MQYFGHYLVTIACLKSAFVWNFLCIITMELMLNYANGMLMVMVTITLLYANGEYINYLSGQLIVWNSQLRK